MAKRNTRLDYLFGRNGGYRSPGKSYKAAQGALPTEGRYEALPLHLQKVVDEYLVDLNMNAAAERCGISFQHCHRLMTYPEFQDAVRERRAMLDGDRAMSGAKFVLNKLWDIAGTDPNSLVALHKVPCRHCYGINGHYQFTKVEMDRLIQAHEYGACGYPMEVLWPRDGHIVAYWHAGNRGLGFDAQGGGGYTTKREPNRNCNECGGDGITLVINSDTRKLKNGARSLYRGVVVNNGRLEIKMANQDNAIEMLARHYGVAVERREFLVHRIDPNGMDDEELSQALAEVEALVIEGEARRVENADEGRPRDEAGKFTDAKLVRPLKLSRPTT